MRTMATLAAGIALGAAGFLGTQAPCTPVAYVNINQVYSSIPRAKKAIQDLSAESEKGKADLMAREKEINTAKGDIEAKFDAGTAEYEKARRAIETDSFILSMDKKAMLDRLMRRQVTVISSVYKEICAEAQRIAASRGYTSVINIDTDPISIEEKGQFIGANELRLQMALRTAVWTDPAHDISKDVIEALSK